MNLEGKQQSLLIFQVGPVLCCAPSLPVRSIITPPKITQTPGSDPSQPGIFKHGSHIVKVIDLRQKFGIDKQEQLPGNLIVTLFSENNFAFWVDKILDVIDFPAEGWGNLPSAIPRGIFSRTLLLNKKINLYSEFEKLATINDCDYLKHYIQQLKQKKENIPENTSNKNQEINPTSINHTTEKEILNSSTPEENKQLTNLSASNNKITPSNISSANKIPFNNNEEKHTATKITTVKDIQREKTQLNKTTSPSLSKTKIDTKASSTSHNINNLKSHSLTTSEKNEPVKQPGYSPQSEDNQLTNKPINNESKNLYTGIILFLMFLAALATGLYYLLTINNSSTDTFKKNKTELNQPQHQFNSEVFSYKKSKLPQSDITKENFTEQFSPKKINNEDKASDSGQANLNNTKSGEAGLQSEKKAENKNSVYHAEITQQNNEITITIIKPVPANIESELKEEQKVILTPHNVEQNQADKLAVEISVAETLQQDKLPGKIPPEKIINEIIHIIVKGDTLWAIAKKYVNDPFLYPELARLSKIKNPHRIFPGNRIRIRFIKN